MKKKKTYPFIDLALHLDEIGYLPSTNGLCEEVLVFTQSIRCCNKLDLFEPTPFDVRKLDRQMKNIMYWGHEGKYYATDRSYKLTQFRKTLLAFCAVLNNEV